MNCRDAWKAYLAGQESQVALHASTCEACASLFSEDEPARTLAGPVGSASPESVSFDVGSAFEALRAEISNTPSWQTVLSERATWLRALLGFSWLTLSLLFVWTYKRRPDAAFYPQGRFVLELVLMFGVVMTLGWSALRPRFWPLRGLRFSQTLATLGVALSLMQVFLPQAHQEHPASLMGLGEDFVARAALCFLFGMSFLAPLYALLVLMARRQQREAVPLGCAIAAGLTGVMGLHLHCPITHTLHIFAGHASVGIALLLVGCVVGRKALG